MAKKEMFHQSHYHMKEQYDDEFVYDNDPETEAGDTFVEMVDDDDSFMDDDRAGIIKYRSSTQK